MKKRYLLIVLAVLAAGLMLVLAGCGKANFSVAVGDDNIVTITAEHAGKGDSGMAGTMTVGENEMIVIEPAFEGDCKVRIRMSRSDTPQSVEEVPDMEMTEDADIDETVGGYAPLELVAEPGDYMISAEVAASGDGMAAISAQPAKEEVKWKDADTAEKAGKKAGLGTFAAAEGVVTSLGTVDPAAYRWSEGIAEAQIPIGAVEMTIRKGKAEGGDISGDKNDYGYEWTLDVDGTEVTCFGNREMEATKTIWTDGGSAYAILAYGAGGDEDYGLPADDVGALVKGVK